MNFVFFVGLFLVVDQIRSCFCIRISDLNFCKGCCDDLEDDEPKNVIESRLDLNYFNNVEALEESEIYKEMKTCVHLRPLISCVDLCLCQNKNCVYHRIDRVRFLTKAFNCLKKELRTQPKWKAKVITMSELDRNNLDLEKCWLNLNRNEVHSVKLKLLEKLGQDQLLSDQLLSDQSSEQNSLGQHSLEQSNNASPIITSNSGRMQPNSLLKLFILISSKIIIYFLI